MATDPYDRIFSSLQERSVDTSDPYDRIFNSMSEGGSAESSSLFRRGIIDPLIGLAKGTLVGIPETVVGLADIPTFGYAGKGVEAITRGLGVGGFKEANTAFDAMLTSETQEAKRIVAETKGFLPTISAAIQNPSAITSVMAESAPSMVGGAGLGRLGMKALGLAVGVKGITPAVKTARAIAAGALGEGAVTAGQNLEQVRQETGEGTLTPAQVALIAGSGAVTGLISYGSGRVAKALGITDIGAALQGVNTGAGVDGVRSFLASLIKTGIMEGALEELPQSTQEQIAQNIALGKPPMEGAAEAGAMGMLAGMGTGMLGAGGARLLLKPSPRETPVQKALKDDSLANKIESMIAEDKEGSEAIKITPILTPATEAPPADQPGIPPTPLTTPPPAGPKPPPVTPTGLPAGPVAPIAPTPAAPVTPIEPERRTAERVPPDVWSVEKRMQLDLERNGPRIPALRFDSRGYASEGEAIVSIKAKRLNLADYDVKQVGDKWMVTPKEVVAPAPVVKEIDIVTRDAPFYAGDKLPPLPKVDSKDAANINHPLRAEFESKLIEAGYKPEMVTFRSDTDPRFSHRYVSGSGQGEIIIGTKGITEQEAHVIALHELGHTFEEVEGTLNGHITNDRIRREVDAFQWAIENAERLGVPRSTVEEMAQRSPLLRPYTKEMGIGKTVLAPVAEVTPAVPAPAAETVPETAKVETSVEEIGQPAATSVGEPTYAQKLRAQYNELVAANASEDAFSHIYRGSGESVRSLPRKGETWRQRADRVISEVEKREKLKAISPSPLPEAEVTPETSAERAARTFAETEAKFAPEAADTESISEREARRKAEKVAPVEITADEWNARARTLAEEASRLETAWRDWSVSRPSNVKGGTAEAKQAEFNDELYRRKKAYEEAKSEAEKYGYGKQPKVAEVSPTEAAAPVVATPTPAPKREGKGTAATRTKIAEGKAGKQTFKEFLKAKGVNQNIGNEASQYYDVVQHEALLAEWKGQTVPATPAAKVIPATAASEATITTPKEQKAYVLDKLDGLITAARERWRAENRNPNPTEAQKEALSQITDKDIDESILKGMWASEVPPVGAETVTINVPNDGDVKVPNTLRHLLTFRRNWNRIDTSTKPSKGYIPIPPPEDEKRYQPGEQVPRRELSRSLPSNKPTGKTAAEFEAEYETGVKAEADKITQARESAKSTYLYLRDTAVPESIADNDKWRILKAEVDDKKKTLKYLASEFRGKAPSYHDLREKVQSVRDRQIDNEKRFKDAEADIRNNYPSLAKEMFGEPGKEKEVKVESAVRKDELTPIQSYFENNVVRPLKDFFAAVDSMGRERLIKNRVMPEDGNATKWLNSIMQQQSSWAKGGRKTGITGIQMLSQKGLWPTTDEAGENLRKSMLAAVQALRKAPGYSNDWVANIEKGAYAFTLTESQPSKIMAAEIVKPENAAFLTITEKQTVTNTKGNEITLEPGEPYRIEHNDDGTVTLIDGKEVKTTIKELKDIKGNFSNTPNIAAGGLTPGQRATGAGVTLPPIVKRAIGTITSTFTDNPQNFPKSLNDTLKNNFQGLTKGQLSGLDYAFSLPFHMSQKYAQWKEAWRIHGIMRPEMRADLRTEHVKYAEPYFKLDDRLKAEHLNRTQRKEAKSRVVRMVFATDATLHLKLADLIAQIQAAPKEQKAAIQKQINDIRSLRRYSDAELRAGIVDEYGDTIKLNSPTEIAAYTAVRHSMDKMMEAKIDWLHTMAFRKWKDQKWYNLILQASGMDLTKENAQTMVGKKGLNAAAIAAAKKIQADFTSIFTSIDDEITKAPADELSAVAGKYDKLYTRVAEQLLQFQSYLGKVTNITDKDQLSELTKEVFAAYVQTRPYLKQIKTLRNQMGDWVGYAPRTRDQGKYKIRLVEMVEDPDDETGTGIPTERPIYSEMFNNEKEYRKLYADLLSKHGDKDGNLPENYFINAEKVTVSPEMAFQGVNDVNTQKIIDDAIENMKRKGTLSDNAAYEQLQQDAYQAIANQFMTRGAGKAQIHRAKGEAIKGYDEQNLDRVLIGYISSMTGLMTKQLAAADFIDLLKGEKDPSMFAGLSKYNREMLRNDSQGDKISGIARSVAFVWFLGGLVKSAAVNLTQNPIVGFAELHKYMKEHGLKGIGDVEYAKALNDVLFNKLSDQEKEFVSQIISKGIAQDQYIQSIFEGLHGKTGQGLLAMARFMAIPFSKSEVYNRTSAGIALFRQAYPMYLKQGLSKEDAYDRTFADARTFIDNVHYAYGKPNRPLWMQSGDFTSKVLHTAYTFRGFTHNFLIRQATLLSKGDWQTFLHTMSYIAVLGGLMGLPFFKDFFDWVEKEFGYSPTTYVRRTLRGIGGKTLETFGMNGLPSVLGANISGSLAIGLPYPIGSRTPEDTIFGVWSGIAQKGQRAMEAAGRGDFSRARQELMPEAYRSPAVAWRESQLGREYGGEPGFATTPRGQAMIDETGKPISIKGHEVALRALGFNPTAYAREKEKIATTTRQEAWVADQKTHITETLRVARLKGDPNAMKDMMNSVRELNQKIRSRGIEKLVLLASVQKVIQASRQMKGAKERREMAYKRAEL